jgi:hypothetical protein
MSKIERRVWGGIAIFLLILILVSVTLINTRISNINTIVNQKADTTLVNDYFWEIRISLLSMSCKQDTIIRNQNILMKKK